MNLLDIHTHSAASGHGSFDTINDMAGRAASLGIQILGITDHGPATIGSCKPSYFRSLSLAPKIRFGIRILYGVELNILNENGTFDLPEDIFSKLDYAAAGMHLKSRTPGTVLENTSAYIKAMENPYVKLICHCDDTSYPVDFKELVVAAKENHVLLELNNVSLAPSGYRGDTSANNKKLLQYCMEYRQPIVLSSDSHGMAHIGDVAYAKAFAVNLGFSNELILNDKPKVLMEYVHLK